MVHSVPDPLLVVTIVQFRFPSLFYLSMNSELLKLPEIVRMVGLSLPRNHQVGCLRVCKLWHDAISPLLWREITLNTGDKFCSKHERPALEGLRTYCHHIRKLKVITDWKSSDEESKLDIEVWRLISDMTGLRELSLVNLVVNASAMVFFDTICARLLVLKLHTPHVDVSDNIKTSAFWSIRELSIPRYTKVDITAFTARCPDLEVIECDFNTKDDIQNCQRFAQYLDSGALPRLKHLDLKMLTSSDEERASLIKSMRCLRKFNSYEGIGPLSYPVFRPHFRTITEIIIQSPRDEVPGLWQEIMSSCPLLTHVEWCNVSVSDVLLGPTWVCTSMRSLQLEIRSGEVAQGAGSGHGPRRYSLTELENITYQLLTRISHLTALEDLWISGFLFDSEGTPKLIPGKGLELLSTLQQLRSLHIQTELWPILYMDAAQWMLDNLMALRSLSGSWTIGSKTTRDSVWMLRQYCDLAVGWEGEFKHERRGGRYDLL